MSATLTGQVSLPGSKSESNRALMIAAYGGFSPEVTNLSEAHDTVLLQQCLRQISSADTKARNVIDCEDAGTVARFLLTYLACHEGEWLLTGTPRMRQRPMGALIDALQHLGADITCQDQQGFLPLLVKGRPISGGEVTINASQSSQFVSSLLLAAPCWKQGLKVHLDDATSSEPYIRMTMAMMRHFGASVDQAGKTITVQAKPYESHPFRVSSDWSSASYWYEFAALSNSCDLLLKDLHDDTIQGDRSVSEMFVPLGVNTSFEPDGARLTKATSNSNPVVEPLSFNVSDNPDLFPTLIVTCVALNRSVVFHGIRNLVLKESNRVDVMLAELSKLYTINYLVDDNSIIVYSSSPILINSYINTILIQTYSDHRVAMAFAPLMTRYSGLVIEHPEVVKKSYPQYWSEIQQLKKS